MKVYEDIKEKIEKGMYKSWSSIEGEQILCEMYGVSRTTIRKAISELKQEGYLHSRQGSGVFVNPPEFYKEKNLTTLSERIEDKEKLENVVLDFRVIEADEDLAEVFNLTAGSKLFYYERLRKVNDVPKVLEKTYMPQYLFKDFNEEVLKGSVVKYIEEDCNRTISHDTKNITAINIDQKLAEVLDMEEGAATLQINHKVYLIKSMLAQYTEEIQTQNDILSVSVR